MNSEAPVQAWHDLYIMLGASSATLIGLIFVAASLHLRDLADNPAFRVRAHHGTLYLLTLLLEAVVILVPQPIPALGIQLLALNLAGLWFPLSSAYSYFYKDKEASHRAGITKTRTMTYSGAYLLGIVGSITLFESPQWGMYLVTASYITLLVAVVLGAWAVALGIGQKEEAEDGR
jgi:hypothetical protein